MPISKGRLVVGRLSSRGSNLRPESAGEWTVATADMSGIRRIVHFDIVGPTDSGRTTLALTAPGPIALAHTAEKVDGIYQQAVAKGKEVRLLNFGGAFKGSAEDIIKAASEPWNRMKRGWYSAVNGWARSAIMDTASEGWELIRLARLGSLTAKGRIDAMYGPVNAEWLSLFKSAKLDGATTNIITIHQEQEVYKNDKPSGKMGHRGMKQMPYQADVIVRMDRDPRGREYTATLEKPWYNGEMRGAVFTGDDIRFSLIMETITGIPESEWE